MEKILKEKEEKLNEKKDENDFLNDKLLDDIKNLNESKKINKSKSRVLKTKKGKLKEKIEKTNNLISINISNKNLENSIQFLIEQNH